MKTSKNLVVLAIALSGLCLFSVACKTADSRGDVAKTTASKCVPRPENAPEGSHFVCHLDCSGKEVAEFGATYEEGMEKVKKHIKDTCRPEDGQHFTFCSCLE